MLTNKKRIRSLSSVEKSVENGCEFIVGVDDISRFATKLKRIGFPESLESGSMILPAPIGPASLYNAEGKYIILKDLPMEKSYSSRDWHWKEFHGPYDRIERSKIVDVPHDRYPRSFVQPPSIELLIAESTKKQKIIISPALELSKQNSDVIIHTVNLFLELFGECQFFTKDLAAVWNIPTRRLNWTILPPGEMPWSQLRKAIDPFIQKAPKGNQPVIQYRLETINRYKPDFQAVGHGGFSGYVILGFKDKNLYTLESIYYGNATYIFDENWEELSKKTKAEILNEKLQTARLIHREGWDINISNLLGDKERK